MRYVGVTGDNVVFDINNMLKMTLYFYQSKRFYMDEIGQG